MALTHYLELDEVRAALGVSDVELPDSVLLLPVYEIGLVRELNRVSTSLPAAFSLASDKSELDRTDLESALLDATHLFCVYACSRQVGVSLGAMAPKDVGDGKATLSRFSDSPYKDVLQRVDSMYTAARGSLIESLALYNGGAVTETSTVPRTIFKASSRSYDPVTG